jgi:hypothetical protein
MMQETTAIFLASKQMPSKALVLVLLLFGWSFTNGQTKTPANKSQRTKATLQMQSKSTVDSTIRQGTKTTQTLKQQAVQQTNKTKADVKEIYKTVFVARDTGLLQEQILKSSNDLKKEAKQLKSAVKDLAPGNVKDAVQKRKGEVTRAAKELDDTKNKMKSSVQSADPKNLQQNGKQNVLRTKTELQGQKDGLKNEIKKPLDFSLNVDNNGTQSQSQTKENWEQRLQSIKNEPGKIGNQFKPAPPGLQPLNSTGGADLLDGVKSIPNGYNLQNGKINEKSLLNESKGVERLRTATERVVGTNVGTLGSFSDFGNAKTVLSQKQLAKLRDSLGLKKFDSIYNKASLLAGKKEVGKEDLLKAINNPLVDKAKMNPGELNESKVTDAGKQEAEKEAKNLDLNSVKLPQWELEKMSPLSGNVIDSKYVKLVDSMKNINLGRQDLSLLERKIDQQYSQVIFKDKPKFWDKAYFDGVVGILGSENGNILQLSPNLGYHIFPTFSIGVGPIISIQQQTKNINTNFGVRSFAKVEVWKQRGYFQIEHQINPGQLDYKNIQLAQGSFLAGGGIVKNIFNNIAINFSILYRVHSTPEIAGSSNWVFRFGVSTVNSTNVKAKN